MYKKTSDAIVQHLQSAHILFIAFSIFFKMLSIS